MDISNKRNALRCNLSYCRNPNTTCITGEVSYNKMAPSVLVITEWNKCPLTKNIGSFLTKEKLSGVI